MIKASDLLIARRADTKARADFSTWRMMAKLNVASSLPAEAQAFLAEFDGLRQRMDEAAAADATVEAIYRSYYAEMGGAGTPPESSKVASPKAGPSRTAAPGPAGPAVKPAPAAPDNVISLKGRAAQRAKAETTREAAKPRLPVALIFLGLILIAIAIRYLLR